MDCAVDAEVMFIDDSETLFTTSSEGALDYDSPWYPEDRSVSNTTEGNLFNDLFDDPVFMDDESYESTPPDSQETLACDGHSSDARSEVCEDDDTREHAIDRIEDIMLDFLSQVVEASAILAFDGPSPPKAKWSGKLEIRLADRRKPTLEDGTLPSRSMKFPQRSKDPSIRPFAQLFRVLEIIHGALIDDLQVTKRDIYYQDVALFKTQRVVDQLVDDIAATIDLGRSDLNIRASLKGLLCGSGFKIHLVDGDALNATDTEPILIPVAQDISRFELNPEIRWVLIVEKEAVFQTLSSLHFTSDPSLPGPGVLITGKGYPDLATRQLVATLSNSLPETIPILALVDGDAYGLDIVSTYKFGSRALRHEEHLLAAERVECIGLWASELSQYGINYDMLLPIGDADEKRALSMLRRPPDILPLLWKRELMALLHTRRKAEIEILTCARVYLDNPGFSPLTTPTYSRPRPPLVQYLSSKIRERVEGSAVSS